MLLGFGWKTFNSSGLSRLLWSASDQNITWYIHVITRLVPYRIELENVAAVALSFQEFRSWSGLKHAWRRQVTTREPLRGSCQFLVHGDYSESRVCGDEYGIDRQQTVQGHPGSYQMVTWHSLRLSGVFNLSWSQRFYKQLCRHLKWTSLPKTKKKNVFKPIRTFQYLFTNNYKQ